jgi:lipid-binding SYLF domain-containing protein
MKNVFALSSAVLVASAAVAAADLSSSETKRLNEATAVVREFRAAPDKGIPENLWSRAECVTVIPTLKKAAFIVGGEFGKGVMSCRSGQTWSAPIFVELEKGSAGLQIGAEQADLVLLMMNREGVDKLLSDKVNLGADASVAAGPVGRTASASTDAELKAGILAYSRAQGAFAGINVSGGVLRPDKSANERAYGASVAPRDVLFKTGIATPAPAQAFVRTLAEESRATTGRK